MPMYIVRWSHERVSMVHADDADELSSTLSERGNLDGVVWDVFEGPLWFDFDLCGTPSAHLADESQRATMCAAERFAASPPARMDDDESDGDALDWADAAGCLRWRVNSGSWVWTSHSYARHCVSHFAVWTLPKCCHPHAAPDCG